MCDIVFEKAKGHGETVNKTSVYDEAAVRRVLSKRCYEKFRGIHQKTSMPESLFWCFLVNFPKFVRTLFLQNSAGRLLLIIAVSTAAKEVFLNETVNETGLRISCSQTSN